MYHIAGPSSVHVWQGKIIERQRERETKTMFRKRNSDDQSMIDQCVYVRLLVFY